ncbi:hypothetical protein OCU04_011669 [Sclerotinia nivalis]|uniref:Heterokaryon incompatibility domain-containing protein n=1 Tax=Sclerotinia nivalis TaxID=352851 RepID=A0A9X0DF04_9HELO|nr:hypothetical protein OCU04_011669 [Sclerotinia nivalis]
MSQSLYSSLLLGPNSTRLLRLMPHENENAEITCRLFVYPLHDSIRGGTHLYEALSYAWGGTDNSRSISVNGQNLIVRENLHAALSRLRDPVLERIIWIDAICINQEDPKERGHQVQLMAKIYSKACRVIIWLGEAADDSDRALKEIVIAAEKYNLANFSDEQFINSSDEQFTNSLDEELAIFLNEEFTDSSNEEFKYTSDKTTNQKAILALLRRPWFQRIWVLQEAAAARNILIRCGPAEMDGYAFCLGLASLEISYEADPGLQSLIRSVTYLIRESIFRPKCATSSSNNYSLNIRPLGELMDMYYTHQATDGLDRVYALLAMSSDNPVSAGLLPDYTILWEQLFRQLVKFLLCKEISVDICQTRRMAVIKSKGRVFGTVLSARLATWKHTQIVKINLVSRHKNLPYYEELYNEWKLPTAGKNIQAGDIICFLQGVSKPMIIRPCNDHFDVIMIAANLKVRREHMFPSWSYSSPRFFTTFPRDFLLVWDLEEPQERIGDPVQLQRHLADFSSNSRQDFSNSELGVYTDAKEHSEMGKYSEAGKDPEIRGYSEMVTEKLDELIRLQNVALILQDSKLYEKAEKIFLLVIRTRKHLQGREHPQTLSSIADLRSLYRDPGVLEGSEKLEEMKQLLR